MSDETGVPEAPEGWEVVVHRGRAGELHGLDLPDHPRPAAWVLDATAPALVLGSAQPDTDVDAARLHDAGLDLVRRRSGGGAVLVVPGACTWVDLVIPAGHPLWEDDIGRAMHWVGALWQRSLAAVGVESVVHEGGMRPSEWSRRVCFAGLGPGEVVDPSGRKLVGVSQRRTRGAARFQTVAYHDDVIAEVLEVLAGDDAERERARVHLGAGTAVVPSTPAAVVAALVAHLPTA